MNDLLEKDYWKEKERLARIDKIDLSCPYCKRLPTKWNTSYIPQISSHLSKFFHCKCGEIFKHRMGKIEKVSQEEINQIKIVLFYEN